MTKISVLMPIYNTKETHLREAIESILNQTYKDFEFLILNDSPENTNLDEIVASYKDKRIKYAKNNQNLGITSSRNKLIKIAKGEFLAVMDHDDVSIPERFAKQIEVFNNDASIGVASSWQLRMASNLIDKSPETDAQIKTQLMKANVIAHSSMMIKKSVLIENDIKYEEEFSPAEDYRLCCKLIPFTKFYNIQEVLFMYREHSTNTSKTQAKKMKEAGQNVRYLANIENPYFYNLYTIKNSEKYQINLFGLIPLVSIVKKRACYKVKLFNFITIFSIKRYVK